MSEEQKNNTPSPKKEQEKVKLTLVALGILAVIILWLISSRIF